eukprot:scaffold4562_cov255-Pinguiococcus_pyrenoidosus.AAC.2
MAATTAACKGSGSRSPPRTATPEAFPRCRCDLSSADPRQPQHISHGKLRRLLTARTTRLEEPSGLGARSALGAFNALQRGMQRNQKLRFPRKHAWNAPCGEAVAAAEHGDNEEGAERGEPHGGRRVTYALGGAAL